MPLQIYDTIVIVQSLSHVQFFETPCTEAYQASLSFTISQSLLKLMSISQLCHPTISSSVIPFSSYLQSFPASGSFPMSKFFASGGQSIGASASVLPIVTQEWFPLGLTGLISLQSKGLSRVFSNTTVQKHQWGLVKECNFQNMGFCARCSRVCVSFAPTSAIETR